jgi:hypothetical protein
LPGRILEFFGSVSWTMGLLLHASAFAPATK